MKRIGLVILAALIISSLVSCDMIKKLTDKFNNASFGDQIIGDGGRVSYEGAAMTALSNTDTSLTVKICNGTDSTWQSGNMRDYSLEAECDGEWYEVRQIGEFANTMELMIFAPEEELTHTFSFGERYGKLTTGRYRVVKSFWANATETREAGEFYLICEFTVK